MSPGIKQHVSVVPRDSRLGRRLAKLTWFEQQMLCAEFEERFSVKVEVVEFDDGPVPQFEIRFWVLRLQFLREFESLAFEPGMLPDQ